jgi:hypothetical protein
MMPIAEGLAKLAKDNGRTWKYGIPEADGLPGGEVGTEWHNWRISPSRCLRVSLEPATRREDRVEMAKNPWVWVIEFKQP